jgi:PIN domain nuclease of toxin-antitoxin system
MRLLLDTHILLWWIAADRRLSKALSTVIGSADSDVVVSAASIWEIAIKRALGRLDLDLDELLSAISSDGFMELPVRFGHSLGVAALPRHHDDPFDRLLVAQAIIEGRRLVTTDKRILSYHAVPGFHPLS